MTKFIVDKLIITNDGNTYVLDYKTGEDDQKNHKQVSKYVTALKEIGYENCKGYLLYIPSMELVQV